MATKHTDTCLQKAADDEPIFVLRAQDKLAPDTVRFWARELCTTLHSPQDHSGLEDNCSHPKVAEAMALADKMEAWPTHKIPD